MNNLKGNSRHGFRNKSCCLTSLFDFFAQVIGTFDTDKNKALDLVYLDFQKTFIIIIIVKTSCTGPSGNNKIVYKLLSQSHKHLRHGKLKNTTQGSNQGLTALLNR